MASRVSGTACATGAAAHLLRPRPRARRVEPRPAALVVPSSIHTHAQGRHAGDEARPLHPRARPTRPRATTARGTPVPRLNRTAKRRAQVILVKTIDPEQGLVNGARGVVYKLMATHNPAVRARARLAHASCADARTATSPCAPSRQVRFDNGVERIVGMESFSLTSGGEVLACRVQLPLALGWAISVHKSQGMTLDCVEMSLRGAFECGQMYVALSRARSLEGLSLRDVDWSKLRAHPKVLAWYRSHSLAQIDPEAA
jgi:hypothetical protein